VASKIQINESELKSVLKMCGICGIYGFEKSSRVHKARGPEAEGHYSHENIGLGHRRLKIIDIEGGVQPMFNKSPTGEKRPPL